MASGKLGGVDCGAAFANPISNVFQRHVAVPPWTWQTPGVLARAARARARARARASTGVGLRALRCAYQIAAALRLARRSRSLCIVCRGLGVRHQWHHWRRHVDPCLAIVHGKAVAVCARLICGIRSGVWVCRLRASCTGGRVGGTGVVGNPACLLYCSGLAPAAPHFVGRNVTYVAQVGTVGACNNHCSGCECECECTTRLAIQSSTKQPTQSESIRS